MSADAAPTVTRRELAAVLALLLALLCAGYANVVFAGRSLVYTDNFNPLDPRPLPQNYGPGMVPASAWADRNLLPWANFHDPDATCWHLKWSRPLPWTAGRQRSPASWKAMACR